MPVQISKIRLVRSYSKSTPRRVCLRQDVVRFWCRHSCVHYNDSLPAVVSFIRTFLSTAVLICHCQRRLSSIIVSIVILIGPWIAGKHRSCLERCRDRTQGLGCQQQHWLKPINQALCSCCRASRLKSDPSSPSSSSTTIWIWICPASQATA